MVNPELIFKVAKSTDRKIGIGVGSSEENVESSVTIANASKYGMTTMFDDAEEMVSALKKGEIDRMLVQWERSNGKAKNAKAWA